MKTTAFGDRHYPPRASSLWPYLLAVSLVALPLLLVFTAYVDDRVAPVTSYVAEALNYRFNASSQFAGQSTSTPPSDLRRGPR